MCAAAASTTLSFEMNARHCKPRIENERVVMRSKFLNGTLFVSAMMLALSAGSAEAAKFTVVHSFVGGSNDGAGPLGGVAPAKGKGFYVATDGGGSSSRGTLTLIRKDGTSQILHTFTGGSDGQNADGTPFQWLDGNLYGTTQFGGSAGCGTEYIYSPRGGSYRQLVAFGCGTEGAFPFAGLADTGLGYMLGTGYNGGPYDQGTLVYYDSDGHGGASCYFSGTDGANPFGGVVQTGNESVTTAVNGGAFNYGTVTAFNNSDCETTVFHSFAGGSDGANPYATLLSYNGKLYGTTMHGGTGGNLGTVFVINPDGSGYHVLYSFKGICCGTDGSFPRSGLTLNTKDGMLYGTTINGGSSSDLGTVFKINPKNGKETIVHAFAGSDGAHPYGPLYISNGTIYGTTSAGGASSLGVVFKLKA
jgi:uncharacterized repeat protein (TIGR03803 family)